MDSPTTQNARLEAIISLFGIKTMDSSETKKARLNNVVASVPNDITHDLDDHRIPIKSEMRLAKKILPINMIQYQLK